MNNHVMGDRGEHAVISCPARYRDDRGTDETTLLTDGDTLSLTLRGTLFEGTDFDILEPVGEVGPAARKLFTLNRNRLCACRLDCRLPVSLTAGGSVVEGSLTMTLELGEPQPHGGLDLERLRLDLHCPSGCYSSTGTSGWFEDELRDIAAALPEGLTLRICFTCRWSDYNPAGHGLFGDLHCFRNLRAEYARVTTKDDLWPLLDRRERLVQETSVCPVYELRPPGTGYRG